jgi:Zn-dependent protease
MEINLVDAALWYGVFLFSTVCHEAAHAWSALRLGDDTASRGGQVSLNPIPHVRREPIGMVVVPLLSWFAAGWIMGWASAPYNAQWARLYPRRTALMAAAGPAANLALVLAAALLIRVGIEWQAFTAPYALSMARVVTAVEPGAFDLVAKLLSIVFSLNLLLCLFNLMPVPPLDGSSLPLLVLPENAARKYFDAMRSPVIQLVGLFIIFRGVGSFFSPVLAFAAGLLHPGSHYQ